MYGSQLILGSELLDIFGAASWMVVACLLPNDLGPAGVYIYMYIDIRQPLEAD